MLQKSVYDSIDPRVTLNQTSTILSGFTRDSSVKPLGCVNLVCKFRNSEKCLKFYVVKEATSAVLGRQACEDMGLMTLVQTAHQNHT